MIRIAIYEIVEYFAPPLLFPAAPLLPPAPLLLPEPFFPPELLELAGRVAELVTMFTAEDACVLTDTVTVTVLTETTYEGGQILNLDV